MANFYYNERRLTPSEIAWNWGSAFAKEHGTKVCIEIYRPDGGYEFQEFDGRRGEGDDDA